MVVAHRHIEALRPTTGVRCIDLLPRVRCIDLLPDGLVVAHRHIEALRPTTGVRSGNVPSGGEVRVVSLKGCLASTAESSSSGGHSSSPVMSDGDSSVDENSFVLRGTNCTGPVGAAG